MNKIPLYLIILIILIVHVKSMEFVYKTGTKFYKIHNNNNNNNKCKNKNKCKNNSEKTIKNNSKKTIKNNSEKTIKNNSKKTIKNNSIWDIIHSNFPDYSEYNYTKNWYLIFFFIPIIFNIHNISFDFIYEFFIKFMILIFFRSLTIISTILPRNCELNLKLNKKTDFWNVIYHKTIGGGYYDKCFSGHTAFGLLLTLLLFKYNFLQTNLFNITLYTIFNIIHFFLIAVTRSHYTVDVVVAIFMTLWVHGIRIYVI
jgi:hypothetical protein